MYPNKEQQRLLNQFFGNSRFLWNKMRELSQLRKENKVPRLGKIALNNMLPGLKIEFPWLKESDSSALQVENAFYDQTWKNHKSNPKHFGEPRFKSRKHPRKSYTGKSASFKVVGRHYVKLPKLGIIKSSKTGAIQGKVKRYTVSLEPSGRYLLSLQIDIPKKKPLPKTGLAVGIDMGIADLAILSDGAKIDTFASGYDNQVTQWQKKMSKRRHQAKNLAAVSKKKDSLHYKELEDFKNWQRARATKARFQEKVAHQRKDYLHKITTWLVKTYDVIVIEDLRTKNLMKNHHLAKSIANASWTLFRQLLQYKCHWYGKTLVVINPRNTSRLCSACGIDSGKKPLDVREWTCSECGIHHDRDINAAKNILSRGLAQLESQAL